MDSCAFIHSQSYQFLYCHIHVQNCSRQMTCYYRTHIPVCFASILDKQRIIRILFIGPILSGHSSTLCHALSLWTSILLCHSPGVATVARHLRYSYSWLRLILVVVSTVATAGEQQCKIRTGGVRRLAVANGPNIFQMLLVVRYKFLPKFNSFNILISRRMFANKLIK